MSNPPAILSAARKEGASTICWEELPQGKWKCLHFLPGHRPLWHTLLSGRSLGPGHTCRTHRPSPSTFHPDTTGPHRMSRFWQETHIPHSTAHDAGLCFDPGKTKDGKKRAVLGDSGSIPVNKRQRDTEHWPCVTQLLLAQGRGGSPPQLSCREAGPLDLYTTFHILLSFRFYQKGHSRLRNAFLK